MYKNKPWQKKFYYVDLDAYAAADLSKQPNQLKLILKHMAESGITDADASEQGGTVVSQMKAAGLQTKIDAPVLFAYYRSTMENFGLVFAGWGVEPERDD
jgi:hypothetical protein